MKFLSFCYIGFWIYIGVFVLEFMARKRACFRGRLDLLFLIARPRKLERLTAAQKSTRRVCAPSRLPWGWGTICTFFACTKKVPKKYTEGLRALLTPGDAVKLWLRFAPQVLRRYRKFRSMAETHKNTFYFYALATAG